MSQRQHAEICIASKRLVLRPFSAGDADATFPCITPSLTRFMSWEPPADRRHFDSIWQAWLPLIASGKDFVFTIRRESCGSFLGLAGLHDVHAGTAKLGIWIREDCHGHGFGREAVRLVATWASRAIDIESFTYPVAEANLPSRRIAESLGGVIEKREETPKYTSLIYRIPGQSPDNGGRSNGQQQ